MSRIFDFFIIHFSFLFFHSMFIAFFFFSSLYFSLSLYLFVSIDRYTLSKLGSARLTAVCYFCNTITITSRVWPHLFFFSFFFFNVLFHSFLFFYFFSIIHVYFTIFLICNISILFLHHDILVLSFVEPSPNISSHLGQSLLSYHTTRPFHLRSANYIPRFDIHLAFMIKKKNKRQNRKEKKKREVIKTKEKKWEKNPFDNARINPR